MLGFANNSEMSRCDHVNETKRAAASIGKKKRIRGKKRGTLEEKNQPPYLKKKVRERNVPGVSIEGASQTKLSWLPPRPKRELREGS